LGDTLLTFPVAEIFKNLGWRVDFAGNTDALLLAKEAGFAERIFSDIPQNVEEYTKIILISASNFLDFPNVVWIPPFPPQRVPVTLYYLKRLGLEGYPFSQELPIKPLKGWENRVILHPGSGSPKKNAPLGFFKGLYRLLEQKGLKPLFVLGEAEYTLEGELENFETYRVENLLEFARRLKGAKLFIGNDSGFTHLAGYLGVNTVALFGPTDPRVWKPLGPRVKVLSKFLPCSPCFPDVCTERDCLKFSPQEVLKVLD
jgi:hypothetical protein